MTVRPDRFDERRRAWIAAHQGTSTIQRRRAEVLGRDVRSRQRAVANAVPDPHDDTVLPPLWLRNAHLPAAQLELMGVLALTLLAPVGWPAGWLVRKRERHGERGVGAALKHNGLPELREVALLAQPIRLTPHEVDARRYRHDSGARGTGRPYAGARSAAGIDQTDRRRPHEPP